VRLEEGGLDVHPIFSGSSGCTRYGRPAPGVGHPSSRPVAPVHPDVGRGSDGRRPGVMTQPDAADKATGARNMVQEEQSWNR